MKDLIKPFWKGLVYEPFNYPYRKIIPNALYGKNSTLKQNLRFLIGFIPSVRNFFYKTEVSERIVEDPFVISEISKLKPKSKVLDFGCFSSLLPLQLSSMGYKVTGIDLNYYKYKHPNFNFINNDLIENKFKENHFDAIYAVSAIEHVGANWYTNEISGITDMKIVDEFYKILKKGGTLLITVPFAKKYKKITDSFVYDEKKLDGLFKKFKIVKKNYFTQESDTVWLPSDKNNVIKYSVACWIMKK